MKNVNPSISFLKFKKQLINKPGVGKMHERLDIKVKAINITSVKLQKWVMKKQTPWLLNTHTSKKKHKACNFVA